ncbi:unnamed protein product [Trichogramma brassicae]|uniref:Uncharacterized protein n=1 Tax=Trichogramma brassicae TaxID=86971 RepID=A0A6H5I0C1_9HYME|nr:unnamed protein product [Trichogramma brassicae]
MLYVHLTLTDSGSSSSSGDRVKIEKVFGLIAEDSSNSTDRSSLKIAVENTHVRRDAGFKRIKTRTVCTRRAGSAARAAASCGTTVRMRQAAAAAQFLDRATTMNKICTRKEWTLYALGLLERRLIRHERYDDIIRSKSSFNQLAREQNWNNDRKLRASQAPAASRAPTRHVADPAMRSSYIQLDIRHSIYIFYSANILAEIALDDEDEDDEPPWMHYYYCCYYFYTRRAQRAFDAIVLALCSSRTASIYTSVHTRVPSVVARGCLDARSSGSSSLESRSSSGDGGGKFPAQLQQRRHRNGELGSFSTLKTTNSSAVKIFRFSLFVERSGYGTDITAGGSGGRCTPSPREVSFTGSCSVRYLFHWYYSSNSIENVYTLTRQPFASRPIAAVRAAAVSRTGRAPKRKSPYFYYYYAPRIKFRDETAYIPIHSSESISVHYNTYAMSLASYFAARRTRLLLYI